VEEDLVKIIAGGAVEDIHEELVDYYDWMTDEEHPNGIIVTDEMELIREHPEYLTLSEEPPTKQQKLLPPSAGNSTVPGTANASTLNTPLATDIGSEAESQTDGRASVQRSPAFAPTPSPRLSPMQLHSSASRDQDEDKEVDMLEDDILDGMDTKPASPPRHKAYLTDPAYLKLMPIRDRLQKSVRDADRDISELSAKVDANSNIIVKVRYLVFRLVHRLAHVAATPPRLYVQNRFKQMLETERKRRADIATELDKVKAEITAFESS
jgi:transcription initiation factor TFIID subunit 7